MGWVCISCLNIPWASVRLLRNSDKSSRHSRAVASPSPTWASASPCPPANLVRYWKLNCMNQFLSLRLIQKKANCRKLVYYRKNIQHWISSRIIDVTRILTWFYLFEKVVCMMYLEVQWHLPKSRGGCRQNETLQGQKGNSCSEREKS
jgi:hypothetical protein